MKYARVLLISTTALCEPTICPGSERAGCPSGVITDSPRCTPRCDPPLCVMRLAAPREDRDALALLLSGLSILLIMGQHGPDDPGIFVG
jgi:hypothetical protein